MTTETQQMTSGPRRPWFAGCGVNSIVDESGGLAALWADGAVLAVSAVSNNDAGNQAGHVRMFARAAAAAAWAQRGADIDAWRRATSRPWP